MSSEPHTLTNRQALLSLIFSCLTLFSFCIGFAPIPFSSLVCYPSAVLFAVAALLTGGIGLYQIRRDGERGQVLAWIGLLSGALTLAAVFCFTALVLSLFPFLLDFFRHNLNQIKFPQT